MANHFKQLLENCLTSRLYSTLYQRSHKWFQQAAERCRISLSLILLAALKPILLSSAPQALLANISGLYAVYHGPEGLKAMANRVNGMACILATGAQKLGHKVPSAPFFDTVSIEVGDAQKVVDLAAKHEVSLV